MAHADLKTVNGEKVLMVDGRPFIMLAGEVHNSNSSSPEYMEAIWDLADTLHMNTLLLPVTWEMTEPEEGKYCFDTVDALIGQARQHHKKIAFLWFGAWKNAACMYAPEWVKTDTERFLRAEGTKGKKGTVLPSGMPYTTLSAFCEETKRKDAQAFALLLSHIREMDEKESTVIAVQVENETGLLGSGRDHCDAADRAFEKPVPEGLQAYLQSHPEYLTDAFRKAWNKKEGENREASWSDVFGSMAEEAFMAYYTASYVNAVAEAGKKEYPLPMTVNCWLDQGGGAGAFPSGGPTANMFPIWKFAAPSIDILCPDIYVPYFAEVCRQYTRGGNPLYIPECAVHSYAGPREIFVIGHHHALCYAPFGFEEIGRPFNAVQGMLFGMDTSDPALKTPQDAEQYAKINSYLESILPQLGEAYGTSRLQGTSSECSEKTMHFGTFDFEAAFDSPFLKHHNGACLMLQKSENEFLALVLGCRLSAVSTDPERPSTEYLLVEEGTYQNGIWHPGRRLNGDETSIMCFDDPTLLQIRVHAF